MGKRAKEHRKKVQKRNEQIKNQQRRIGKLQRAFFEQIMKEKEAGAYENTPTIPGVDGPQLDGPAVIDGPQI